ncbi:hypothetical protein [Thermomonospora umbrina]|uniref:4-amino-4-deoxy-L-arabinose transferase-like glycosyltransferase n=1 Tax=Thermomonospora umbrina TaxID=111806 RepID=A0A3D9SKF4_9ACTN|nr:hypothetical protein [Thermomonospora umbrina]REE96197.1 4-amino-4-deoxy-L-arabinose transferase-like glycosyltransferase [Thermomonospora umbrina]
MTVTAGSEVSGPAGPGAGARRRPPWWLLLLVGWLAQVGVRVWLAAGQTIPVANPDESGYLFTARLLTGGPEADISNSTPYRGGYPLLILPAQWLSDDPETVYRIVMVVNALVAACLLPLAHRLLRGLGLAQGPSYALAHVTALLPAAVFYTQYALTDAVFPVVVMGWLLLMHSWLVGDASRARVIAYGLGASGVAAYTYALHSRGVVILAVHVGLLLFAAWRRWRPWTSAVLGVGVAGAVAGAASVLNGWIVERLYTGGTYDMGSMVVDRLTGLDGYGWTLPVGLGQIWYMIIGTWGVGGIGLVAVSTALARRDVPARVRALAAGLLVIVVGIAFSAAAALPDEQRIGNHAYSRYLACVAPVFFAVGAWALLRSPRKAVLRAAAVTGAAVLAGAALIEVNVGDELDGYAFTLFDFPELTFLTWDWDSFHLWRAALVALALLGVVLVLGRYAPVALVAFLLAVNTVADVTAATRISRPFVDDRMAAADLRGVLEPGRQTVAIDRRVDWEIWIIQLHQVWWSKVLRFDSRKRQQPPPEADLVLVAWNEGLAAEATWRNAPPGWRVVRTRRHPLGSWVAWRRP